MSAPMPSPPWFASTLTALMNRRDLDGVRMCELMHGLVGGACDETATAALLIALGMKGETADELATAAAVLREYMVAVSRRPRRSCSTPAAPAATARARSTSARPRHSSRREPAFRWSSTATARRRAASGSADVLAALGVSVEGDAACARRCLDGWAWLSASRRTSIRLCSGWRPCVGGSACDTLFNLLGPLANPARAPYQLLGVGRAEHLDRAGRRVGAIWVRATLCWCAAAMVWTK